MAGNSKTSINLEDFKNLKEQLEKAHAEAQKEENKKVRNEETPKQSVGNKIVGIIVLIALLALAVVVVISNIDLLFLPKNSVTIIASDQDGNVIKDLTLVANSGNNTFSATFDETSGTNQTILGVKPGDYTITFTNIPENYDCNKISDQFTMSEGDKIKLEYECTKVNE